MIRMPILGRQMVESDSKKGSPVSKWVGDQSDRSLESTEVKKTVNRLCPTGIIEWTSNHRHHMGQSQCTWHGKRDRWREECDICSGQRGIVAANSRKLRTPTLSKNHLKYSGAKYGNKFSNPWLTNPFSRWCQAPYRNRQQEAGAGDEY